MSPINHVFRTSIPPRRALIFKQAPMRLSDQERLNIFASVPEMNFGVSGSSDMLRDGSALCNCSINMYVLEAQVFPVKYSCCLQ